MPAEKWRIRQNSALFRPIPELEEMRRRFEEDVVRPVMHAVWERIPEEAKAWSPAIDIFEKGEGYTIKIDLPGMKQEDIDLSISEDALTIKGDRKPEIGVKEGEYQRSEISYGGFYRSIPLPAGVNTQSIEAIYDNGVLRITVQRVEGAKPKKVNVQVKSSAE